MKTRVKKRPFFGPIKTKQGVSSPNRFTRGIKKIKKKCSKHVFHENDTFSKTVKFWSMDLEIDGYPVFKGGSKNPVFYCFWTGGSKSQAQNMAEK